ncbi:PREDICTED: uncharacterized protein LOC104595073 [Nelumbo nucifera]|uniref:Uncharacterized protein LOC104595073 n=2 Tax=Nelumbo nucifera TaxID=4432 RepID=A0A1U7ZPY0_NELNU|nr:PREDICTED: uncharacterized protein LOC104595073 [Nelumbo nucifera]DAD36074.1 TPA_asm: hypothetical protein HUJ06_006714 [Nelumbo nucifera]
MGSCASRPKELNGPADSLPTPPSPHPTLNNVQPQTDCAPKPKLQENNNDNNGGEIPKEKEEPLIDLSEPSPKATNSDADATPEPKPDHDQVMKYGELSESNPLIGTANQTEENSGAAGNQTTDKVKNGPAGVVADPEEKGKPDIDTDKSDNASHKQPLTSEI